MLLDLIELFREVLNLASGSLIVVLFTYVSRSAGLADMVEPL